MSTTTGPTTVGGTRHTLRVLAWEWRATLQGAAEYRTDLVTGTLVSVLWLAISAVPSLVVSLHTDGAGGWTLPRLMYLLAVWYLMDAVMWIVVMPNISAWGEMVRTGSLDAILLRPVDSLLLASLRTFGVQDAPKILLAIGLGVASVAAGGGPQGAWAVLGSVVCVLCGMVLMWAAAVLACVRTLSQVQFDASFLVHAGLNLARVPVPLYGGVVTVLLTWVVPVAFVATVPAQVMFGMVTPWVVLAGVALAAAAVGLAVLAWRSELRRYAGAMS